ncbi:MAG: MerR family transcriptional regulator [Eubacterium sp.]
MKEYSTSQIAKEFGIHPNTVRFYEEIEFLPAIPRKKNGYRVYSQIHYQQLHLIKTGLNSQLLQNGLRKQVINIIKVSARGEYDRALCLAKEHLQSIAKEKANAKEAIRIVEDRIQSDNTVTANTYSRKQVATLLGLTTDTIRNWELNGLLTVKRKENGYRVYNDRDIKRLKIISSLRCANYSLSAILRLLSQLDENKNVHIQHILDTPKEDEDIVSACDKLLQSLDSAEEDCRKMIAQIEKMKKQTLQLNTNV